MSFRSGPGTIPAQDVIFERTGQSQVAKTGPPRQRLDVIEVSADSAMSD